MDCPKCGKSVPDERKEILDVDTCKKCTEQPGRLLGFFEFGTAEEGPHAGGEGLLRIKEIRK